MNNQYDVAIIGGGLAGLTLSLQLKKENQNLTIIVLEMRAGDAPDAAHKVGESTVELGTHYLREVLNLKGYLDEHQLPKHGLRFFFTPEHKDDISKRVELGPRERLPIPSHQIDRGTFENELVKRAKIAGVEVVLGAKVTATVLNEEQNQVTYKIDSEEKTITSSWVIDASGRSSFLKRKLGLKKDLDHAVNSAWFRVKGEVDVDKWSDNAAWNSFLKPGLRRLGTIHFMDKGYWVWLIPLATGNTSVGIVADPKFHPFNTYNKLDKAMDWLAKNEPLCYQFLKDREVLDFRVLKHFAHHTEKLYSTERWALTGESGLFLDPFYSPGTDFIAINNTFITDLIIRENAGEDIHLRTNVFEQTHFSLFDNWVPIYQNKYSLWGSTQTMVLKIFWDWATYWSVPTLLFTNEGLTDIAILRALFSTPTKAGQKFGALNAQMQDLFVEWSAYDLETFTDRYIDPFDLAFLRDFHKGLDVMHPKKELIKKVEDNVVLLEQIAITIFRLMSNKVNGTPLTIEVNPYDMSLKNTSSVTIKNDEISASIVNDVEKMWFYS